MRYLAGVITRMQSRIVSLINFAANAPSILIEWCVPEPDFSIGVSLGVFRIALHMLRFGHLAFRDFELRKQTTFLSTLAAMK